MIRVLCGASIALAIGLVAVPGQAHGGLSAGTLQVSVVGQVAHINATPPPELFAQFDTNADGELDEDEVGAQRAEMLSFFLSGLAIQNADGDQGEYILQDLALPVHLHEDETPYVRVTLRAQWAESPETLQVDYAHAEVAPLRVSAMRPSGDAALRTTGQLDPEHPSIALFHR
ncbi:MAG: hypothetical protein ACJAYU_002601 [Bradymonadia bacterium]|jgi:hypothetical protein